MEEKKNKFLSGVAKVAHSMGKNSVGKCFHWFNQPRVPEAFRKENQEK